MTAVGPGSFLRLVVVLSMAPLVACGGGTDGERASQTTSTVAAPASTSSVPSTTSTTEGTTRAVFPGIWPFSSQAEVDAYAAGAERAYLDPASTARQFAARYLGMRTPASFGVTGTGSTREVAVGSRVGEGGQSRPNAQATTLVSLEQLGPKGPSGPWSVVGARSAKIESWAPGAHAMISSPVTLTGRANVFEGTVTVLVKEDGMAAGQSLGRGFVTGSGSSDGELGPFRGDVTFRKPTKAAGAVVLSEGSEAEGQGVLRATVVRVRFAG